MTQDMDRKRFGHIECADLVHVLSGFRGLAQEGLYLVVVYPESPKPLGEGHRSDWRVTNHCVVFIEYPRKLHERVAEIRNEVRKKFIPENYEQLRYIG